MYSAKAENQLILPDIADAMQDYVSIQLDIDNSKVKAAALVAQNVDLKRLIGQDVLDRLIDQDDETPATDKALKDKIIPPLCYFTYSRCLLMFQGTFTDSGYTIEDEGEARNAAKSVSKEMKGIAETLMLDIIDELEDEEPGEQFDKKKATPRVRVFGGCERRASN